MDVSIIIINYNTFDLTSNCIRSIVEQTRDVSYEIILVDNASVEKDAVEFSNIFSQIVLVKSNTNLGFAKGCNLGIEHSKGDYILLLNSDTVLVNNAVLLCYHFLRRNTRVAVVSSRLQYPDGSVQNNCQRFPSIKYGLFELLRIQKFLPKKMGGEILFGSFFNYDTVAYPDWVWGTFFMFEKRKLNQLPMNKLADDFFMYVEDMQWCMDFRLKGYTIAFEPAAKVIHLVGKSEVAGENRSPKATMMLDNATTFMNKYYPVWEIKLIRRIRQLLTGETAF